MAEKSWLKEADKIQKAKAVEKVRVKGGGQSNEDKGGRTWKGNWRWMMTQAWARVKRGRQPQPPLTHELELDMVLFDFVLTSARVNSNASWYGTEFADELIVYMFINEQWLLT